MDADRRRLLLFRKLYPFLQWLPGFILLQNLDRHVRFANRYLRERFGEPGDRPLHEVLFGEQGPRPDWDPEIEPGADSPWEWEGPLADGRVYRVCALPFTEEDGSSLVLLLGVAGPDRADRTTDQGDGEDAGRRAVGTVAEFARAALPKLRVELAERDRMLAAAQAERDAAERERRALAERARALEEEVEGLRLSLRMGRALLLGTQRTLAESRERFRAVGECVPHGVWSCGPDGGIRFVSPAFLDLLGMTETECRRSGWEGRLHPDDASRTRAAWRRAVASGKPLEISCRFLGADGRVRRILLRSRPVRDASGAVTGWAGVALDGDGPAGTAEGPARGRGQPGGRNRMRAAALPDEVAQPRPARRRRTREAEAADPELSFRSFMENVLLTGFAATDVSGRIVFVNDAFCAMTDFAREDLLGMEPPYRFCSPGDPASAPDGDAACRDHLFGAGVPSPSGGAAFRLAKRDGKPVDVLGYTLPLRDAGGTVRGYMGSVHDITDRMRAEQALRDSEDHYRKLVEMARDIIFVVDPQGNTTSLNPAFEQILGWSRDEWIGRPLPAILHPEDVASGVDRLRRSFGGETLPVTIYRARTKSGGYRTFESLGFPLVEKGKPVAVVGVSRDVTERVEAEKKLRELSQALREIVHASPLAIVVLDPEGRVELWNPAAEQTFGWTDEEVSGHPAPVIPGEDREAFGAILARALAGERLANLEIRGVRKDGAALEALVSLAPLKDAEGIVRSALVVLADITQVREMERIALNQEKMASLGHVAAGVAHEIRNPLSGLNIHLSALGKTLEEVEGLEPEVRETVRTILKMASSASGKIEGVVRRVLDLANPAPPKMGIVSVNACVRETLHLAMVTLRKGGIRLTETLASGLPKVRGDACLLEQVLLNLLTNAVQAMEGMDGEKRIEVVSGHADGYVTVSVADSGPGVSEATREKIFDPFFTTKKEGTGIGLSLSHRVVSDHGGFLRVGQSPLGGALFTIGLPAGGAEATADS